MSFRKIITQIMPILITAELNVKLIVEWRLENDP